MTYAKVIVGCMTICVVFCTLVFEALFDAIGVSAIARTIVVGWITLGFALWIVAMLWLWRTRVCQEREQRIEFPRARARSVR